MIVIECELVGCGWKRQVPVPLDPMGLFASHIDAKGPEHFMSSAKIGAQIEAHEPSTDEVCFARGYMEGRRFAHSMSLAGAAKTP